MSKKQIKKTTSAKTTAAKKSTKPKATVPATRSAAKKQAASQAAGTGAAAPRLARGGEMPAVGTVIKKIDRYGVVRCECTVEEGGIRYERTLYSSLSAAAMAAAKDLGLTNKTQNGWTFWGLTKPARPSSDPLETLPRAWERYRGSVTAAVKDGVNDENRDKVRVALETHAQGIQALREQVA